jgi:hypothetical protein
MSLKDDYTAKERPQKRLRRRRNKGHKDNRSIATRLTGEAAGEAALVLVMLQITHEVMKIIGA